MNTPTNTNRRLLMLQGGALALSLAGCAAPRPDDYAAERPLLDIQSYFNGRLDAWGMFTDRGGRVVKRFTVAMECSWSGDNGTFDEAFVYSDGTRQRRVWQVSKTGEGRYVGRADDVVGQAQGRVSGNAIHWVYTLALPVDGRVWNVEMDDWMHLVSDRVLLNRTVMSKFGITLGEVTLSFTKAG